MARRKAVIPRNSRIATWCGAILCTVLCCLPLGIVSIVYASKVSGLWTQGRYAEAQLASANAKKWAIWGAVAGVILGIIYAIIAVAGGMSNYM